MLDRSELEMAVELHRRAHGLLRWLEHPIRTGAIQLETVHANMSAAAAAQEWVRSNYVDLPGQLRPRRLDGPELERFANLFASYLTASFDLVEVPGRRLVRHCRCPLCLHLVSLPHAQPKRLGDADKHRARELMRLFLAESAASLGLVDAAAAVDRVLADPAHGERAAMATYGEQLIRRMHGDGADPSALALWRMFAWERTGSPKQGFELSAAGISQAESELGSALVAAVRGG